MRNSKTLIAIALAVASLGTAGVAEAAKSATKITIDNDDGTFSGSLSSKKASCESGRKVTLSQVIKKGKITTLKKVGSDVTNDDGDWSVDSDKIGKFLASTKATKSCNGVTSKTITVADDE